MTDWVFRLFNLDTGTYIGDLPDYTKISAGFEYSAISSFSCDYPLTGRFASLLDTDIEIAGLFKGVEAKNARWVSRGVSGNTVDDNGGKTTIVGLSIMDLWRKVIVYANTTFTAQTPGAILKTLLQTATTRGAFGATATTASTFSNTLDSNGNAWATTLTVTYGPGATYRQILEQMVSIGVIDFQWNGRDLQAYNGTTMGTTRSVVLAAGRNVSETPFKESTEDRANVVLVEGDNGVLVERTTSGPRREETYLQQTGITNAPTLNVIGDNVLAGLSIVKTQKVVKIPNGSTIEPFQDFVVGDFIIYDDGLNLPSSVRVRQVALEIDQHGNDSYSVALNDLLLEADIKRALALQAITGGIGSTTIGVPTSPPTVDTTTPSAPATCTFTSSTYVETQTGQIRAQITVSWSAVTTNTDATAIGDLDRYEVQYQGASTPLIPPTQWSASYVIDSATTVAYFGPFSPGSNVTARVRAVDTSGHASAWTSSSTAAVVSDTTPPTAPSTPTVVTQFRGIQVTWNGLDNVGGAMAADFDHLDLHVSTTNNFTPTTGTKVDSITTRGGVFSVQGLTYGTTYYAKLIAVDTSGNSSAASAQGSATPQTLVTGDVPGTFITNAMIANLAVDDAKIATVSAGKITVGTLIADITVSARIKTGNTGARVEMNSGGVFGYNSINNPVFQLKNDGTLWMQGTLDTGTIQGGSARFPHPLAQTPGYTMIDGDGLFSAQAGTTNLITRPSGENVTGLTLSTGTTATSTGALTTDFAQNTDLVGYYGKRSLKVYNTTNANGFVDVPISGPLTPSSDYTYSFHAAITRIDDSVFGLVGVFGNFSNIGIIEKFSGGGSRQIAQGVDAKVITDGPFAGIYRSGLPTTGVDTVGNPGWQLRWIQSFVTPSDVSATSTYWLRLPAPCTSGGGLETTYAVCYDGMQMENTPYATRYCDGDQANCSWTGTAHASTSTRIGIVGTWLPAYGEPLINGRLSTPDLRVTNTIKKGSGAPQGTNYAGTLRSTNQSIATGVYTDMVFNVTTNDRLCADDGTIYANSKQFLSQQPGMYAMECTISWNPNNTGVRVARWVTVGGTIVAVEAISPGTQGLHIQSCSGMGVLPGNGYYVNVEVLQNSGASLAVLANSTPTAPTSAAFCQIG